MTAFTSIFGTDHEPIAHGRVVSLLDMLKAYAASFFNLGHVLEELIAGVKSDKPLTIPISDPEDAKLSGLCRQLREACDDLGMPMTASAIDRFRSSQPQPVSRLELVVRLGEIRQRALDELVSRVFLHLSSDQARLWGEQYPFGKQIEDKFPKITPDLSEAAKCMALERHTAAAFHLTRVLEFGLDKFVERMKATPAARAVWGQKLSAVKGKIDAMPQTTKAQLKKYRRAMAVYEAFHSVKEAWRNPLAHDLGLMHTPDQVQHLFDRTKQVFQELLEFLNLR